MTGFDPQLLLSVFITLFVIMDPPGTVPIFLALTGAMTRAERARAARQAVLVAFGVVVAFAGDGGEVGAVEAVAAQVDEGVGVFDA